MPTALCTAASSSLVGDTRSIHSAFAGSPPSGFAGKASRRPLASPYAVIMNPPRLHPRRCCSAVGLQVKPKEAAGGKAWRKPTRRLQDRDSDPEGAAMNATDRTGLITLLDRLGSPDDGEVLAAARAID